MIEEKICSVATKIEGEISDAQQAELKQRLDTVSDDKYEAVISVKTKSVKLTVILSAVFGLFGAGSFYLGLVKRGICKVVFNIILPLTLGLIFLYWFAPLHKEYMQQSEGIYKAVTESESYDYSFDKLKAVQTAYISAYKSFNDSIATVIAQRGMLISVMDYLLPNDGVNENEVNFNAFSSYLSDFTQDVSINALLNEIDNSLIVFEGLTDEEERKEYKDFYELTAGIENIFAAQEFLANLVRFAKYAELIENLLSKHENLYNAKTFDSVDFALNELQPVLNEVQQKYNVLQSSALAVTKSEITNLLNRINVLNNFVFDIQKDQHINTVESSKETELGLAIANVEKVYKAFSVIEIGNDGNKLSLENFINEFTVHITNATSSFEIIYKASFPDGSEENKDQNLLYLIDLLKAQKDIFVENSEDYFKYLNTDFVNELKNNNKKLSKTEKEEVDNKVLLSMTVSEVNLLIEGIKSDTNIDTLQINIDKVSDDISGLQTSADKEYYNYRFNYMVVNIFFSMVLAVDGITVVVYWIFEVFREREKCQNKNYTNIMLTLK